MLAGLPLSAATLLAVKSAPPWAVTLVATAAAGVTAIIDHTVVRRTTRLSFQFRGRQVSVLKEVTSHRLYPRVERAAKVAPFLTTAAFAGFPLPFWMMRILMPLIGFPLLRYVPAV